MLSVHMVWVQITKSQSKDIYVVCRSKSEHPISFSRIMVLVKFVWSKYSQWSVISTLLGILKQWLTLFPAVFEAELRWDPRAHAALFWIQGRKPVCKQWGRTETMRGEQGPNDIVFNLYILPSLKPLHFSFSWGNKSPFHLRQAFCYLEKSHNL